MPNILLKVTESDLMAVLWKFQNILYEQGTALTKENIEQIEKHWKLLKLVTEDVFETRYNQDNSSVNKIGNV